MIEIQSVGICIDTIVIIYKQFNYFSSYFKKYSGELWVLLLMLHKKESTLRSLWSRNVDLCLIQFRIMAKFLYKYVL